MVLFVDLEDETEPPEQLAHARWTSSLSLQHDKTAVTARRILGLLPTNASSVGSSIGPLIVTTKGEDIGRENPNKNSLTEALGCYPYADLLHCRLIKWQRDVVLEVGSLIVNCI